MKVRQVGALGILAFFLSGCVGNLLGGRPEPTLSGKQGSIAISRLDVLLDGFCDRDVVIIADACDAIQRECCSNASQRSLAHRLKTNNAISVYDIVSSPNTLSHLADLYVVVQLQYQVWVTEDLAFQLFGERGRTYATDALEEVRTEISHIADLAMKPERRATLDEKILKWRRNNPQAGFVSMVRFGNLAGDVGGTPLEALNSLFEILNPLDQSDQQVEDARKMAERVFYFGKRLSKLVSWQTETLFDETLAGPEVNRLLNNVNQSSASVDRITKTIESLPQTVATERKEILAAWDAREEHLNATVKEIRSTLGEAREFTTNVTGAAHAWKDLSAEVLELAKSVDQVVREIEKLSEPSKTRPPGEAARPFNITEYSAAAVEFTKLANEIRDTIAVTNTLLESPAWLKRQEDVGRLTQQAVEHAGERGKNWVDHLMFRVVEVLVVFFILLLGYRVACNRIVRRHGGG